MPSFNTIAALLAIPNRPSEFIVFSKVRYFIAAACAASIHWVRAIETSVVGIGKTAQRGAVPLDAQTEFVRDSGR